MNVYDILAGGTFRLFVRIVEQNRDHPVTGKAVYLLDESDPRREVMKYGIYIFYINTLKTLLLLIVALFFGILPQICVFALAYAALRLFSFGVHLKTPLGCTVLGLVYYLGGTFIAMRVIIPFLAQILLWCGCFLCFALFAPAQTKKRPIPQRQRKPYKIKALTVLSVLMATAIYAAASGYFVTGNLILSAAVCQTVNILPLTYKIVKE